MKRYAAIMRFVMIATMACTISARVAMAMNMPAEGPAHFTPTRSVYTSGHAFLIKLVKLPTPIPFEKYFILQFGVYSGHAPHHLLTDATITLNAGMRHGMKHGFAHGMQSAPKITAKDGIFIVSGMYFHMMGPWVLKLSINRGATHDVAYFKLPCCGN